VPRRGFELPRLDEESWRELRRLILKHGYDELLRVLRVAQMVDILEPPPNVRDAQAHDLREAGS
jgi:hypothetical protein